MELLYDYWQREVKEHVGPRPIIAHHLPRPAWCNREGGARDLVTKHGDWSVCVWFWLSHDCELFSVSSLFTSQCLQVKSSLCSYWSTSLTGRGIKSTSRRKETLKRFSTCWDDVTSLLAHDDVEVDDITVSPIFSLSRRPIRHNCAFTLEDNKKGKMLCSLCLFTFQDVIYSSV